MADPVSWLMIEPGWRVLAADGSEAGRVDKVTGDTNADIFDGLAVTFTKHGKQHYVPAEQVAEITEGAVGLTLDETAIAQLPGFTGPPEELEISSEKAPLTARLSSWLSGRR